MSSRRAAHTPSRSHARRKDGLRLRNVVLALSAITVTAGVGFAVATGGDDQDGAADRIRTNAAADVPSSAVPDTAASSASPSPSTSPKASATPSKPAASSAPPKRKASPEPVQKAQAKPAPRRTASSGGAAKSAPASGGSSGSGSGSASGGTEAEVLTLVNKERAAAGCSPLTSNSKLARAADDYSDVMADSGVMSHTGPDGSTMTSRVEAAGYAWSNLGENIARGQADAGAVMDAWMNSPGHKANILNCDFKEIGVGVHFGDGGPWWTQNFGASR
ncbi:CAP domain-containing protein [Streptomyces sp. NBC_01142]|uniref:CAP domain-containing protein n=1 Tax=Streptomyces sp. NBC_01142 TaxID=2975865 RepID=UPI002252FE13|nr:CAP domain-containing protein [Streptomyces sp. NBC_01142]MCX4824524.1 CAP domain-containing protein [Streptomyces sp. NBC_01142]